ncbi:iron-containing alcohol dehydrogenase [bacterium]|nr:iron-containing alcohol dehydrogenase [bacterium]
MTTSVPPFEFATATRIIFGAGRLAEAGAIARGLGRRALVVAGMSAGAHQRAEPLLGALTAAGAEYATFSLSGEPTVAVVRAGLDQAQSEGCDLVIGMGGGSVIDTGKAIAALLTNTGDPLDYLEVIGRGVPITQRAAPYIAIPTTAGTGAEVTRNAVLGSPEHKVKVSLRSPLLLPRVALVDPELTLGLPPAITASTGLDALTQLIEPYVSAKANPLADALGREGISRAARSLRRAYEHGDDRAAREDMAVASLCGGLALANAGLGAVHGLAAPLGGMFDAPHGAVCAALLPHVMEANVGAMRLALPKYEEIARILTGSPSATAGDGVAWVRELVTTLRIPRLAMYGLTRDDFPAVIEKASAASSMKANPVPLGPEALRGILEAAL